MIGPLTVIAFIQKRVMLIYITCSVCERVWDLRDLSLVALESVDTVECGCVEHTGRSCRESVVPR